MDEIQRKNWTGGISKMPFLNRNIRSWLTFSKLLGYYNNWFGKARFLESLLLKSYPFRLRILCKWKLIEPLTYAILTYLSRLWFSKLTTGAYHNYNLMWSFLSLFPASTPWFVRLMPMPWLIKALCSLWYPFSCEEIRYTSYTFNSERCTSLPPFFPSAKSVFIRSLNEIGLCDCAVIGNACELRLSSYHFHDLICQSLILCIYLNARSLYYSVLSRNILCILYSRYEILLLTIPRVVLLPEIDVLLDRWASSTRSILLLQFLFS